MAKQKTAVKRATTAKARAQARAPGSGGPRKGTGPKPDPVRGKRHTPIQAKFDDAGVAMLARLVADGHGANNSDIIRAGVELFYLSKGYAVPVVATPGKES